MGIQQRTKQIGFFLAWHFSLVEREINKQINRIILDIYRLWDEKETAIPSKSLEDLGSKFMSTIWGRTVSRGLQTSLWVMGDSTGQYRHSLVPPYGDRESCSATKPSAWDDHLRTAYGDRQESKEEPG